MSRRVNWTPESEKTFNQNLEYLANDWDNTIINDFLDRVEVVIEKIKSNPRLYPEHRAETRIHKCVIHERIVLYYKIVDEDRIDLLTFWNTYQNPDKLRM